MRSVSIVLVSEASDDRGRLEPVVKPLRVQALVTEAAVEALVQPVLPRLARLDVRGRDRPALALQPESARARGNPRGDRRTEWERFDDESSALAETALSQTIARGSSATLPPR